MSIQDILQSAHDALKGVGIEPTVLYAGGFGGLLRALSRKRFIFREVIASPICGALAAAYLTMPFVSYVKAAGLPMPGEDPIQAILASAFLIGTCGMWISDMAFDAVAKWLRVKEE